VKISGLADQAFFEDFVSPEVSPASASMNAGISARALDDNDLAFIHHKKYSSSCAGSSICSSLSRRQHPRQSSH